MRTTTPIMIPVFEYTEEEIEQEKLNIGDPETMGFTQTKDRAYYSIDSVYAWGEHTVYGAFFSGGTTFVSPLSMDELIKLINNHNK